MTMNEMWQAIDLLLDHYEKEYGTKPIGEMTEGSEEWYARVLYSLLTTLSIMHEEGNDAA